MTATDWLELARASCCSIVVRRRSWPRPRSPSRGRTACARCALHGGGPARREVARQDRREPRAVPERRAAPHAAVHDRRHDARDDPSPCGTSTARARSSSTVAMTLLLFIFAEVTPKTFARPAHRPRRAAIAPIIVLPRAGCSARSRTRLLRLANVLMPGKGLKEGPFVTEQEIRAMAEVASEEGSIEEEEKELIHSIFEFGDTIVREVMVPRPDIVAVEDTSAARRAGAGARARLLADPRLPRGSRRRRRGRVREGRPEGPASGQARHAAGRHHAPGPLRARDQEGRRPAARDAAREVPPWRSSPTSTAR